MGNFKFKVALNYCKEYEEKSKQTLNLFNDFITPSFIATIAAFVKSHNIKRSNFTYQGKIVLIDLSETDVISGSFADECVGVLVKMYDFKTVTTKIKLLNGNGFTERSIVSAILERKNETTKVKTNSDFGLTPV